jgi:5-methyltetrahydrofolate--homocysteine methyltransferase
MADFKEISENLLQGEDGRVKQLVQTAVKEGVDPEKILNEGLICGMQVVGLKFKNREIYVPEVLLSARAMHAGMDVLEPLLGKAATESRGVIVVGTVKGDLHDIGKNLVATMMKGAGWKVIDIGVDADAEQFVRAAIEQKANIIGLSALLTTTMGNMGKIVTLAKNQGCKAKILVGGAPLTQSYADEIGADGYAADAATAVEVASRLT